MASFIMNRSSKRRRLDIELRIERTVSRCIGSLAVASVIAVFVIAALGAAR